MAFTSGFFNSLSGDRRYDAVQLSSIFDGLVRDGVYLAVGDAFAVTSMGGLDIGVGTGRAWFNKTWSLNDAIIPITLEASEALLHRVDSVVLEINTTSGVRANSIKVLKSQPASVYSNITSPVVPSSGGVYQYLLAEIQRDAASTSISQAKVKNFVGTTQTPYVTGLLETYSTSTITAQFEARFTNWFTQVQDTLDGNSAGNLLNMINQTDANVAALDTRIDNLEYETGWVNATPGSAYSLSDYWPLLGKRVGNHVVASGAVVWNSASATAEPFATFPSLGSWYSIISSGSAYPVGRIRQWASQNEWLVKMTNSPENGLGIIWNSGDAMIPASTTLTVQADFYVN
jgi:hypothetical protein